MTMMNFNGQGLQRKYASGISGNMKTLAEKDQMAKDQEALRSYSQKRREQREKRMQDRIERNLTPDKAIKRLEENPMADPEIKDLIKDASAKTNVLARTFGLPEPNNPEALEHDRTHCMTCDRKLDQPKAHKQLGVKLLEDEEEVRLMCCWCFGRFDDSEIKSTMYSGMEADAKIRLAVYNPVENKKEEIEALTDLKMIQLKSKLKRWEQDTALVGKIKHDVLEDSDWMENCVRNNAKSRYNACTL